MTEVLVALFGLIIGSFLNVCIYRIPKNLSIVFPNSHCPKCKKEINWYDNIPIVSFLMLLGRCRYCKTKISKKYLIVEVLVGILFLISYRNFGLSTEFISSIIFISFLVVIALIDLKTGYIYDITVVPLAIIGFVFSLFIPDRSLLQSLSGFAVGGSIFLAIYYISLWLYGQEGMGMGDVKLAAVLGVFLGWKNTALMIVVSFVIGGIISVCLLLLKKKRRMDPVPFGPFLVLGTFITVFAGDRLINILSSGLK
ncbi:MAG: prepilin peptidase [Candidatus Firestonebacteria bacterium]|nr:prepilin peptidase [Candidatus Firestonebacteria bacterium]